MKGRILTGVGIVVGLAITATLVAAAIWPVINEVETGKTPEYPDIQPQYYTADPKRVFEASVDSISSMERWKIVSKSRAEFTLEATHETYVFGFIDDVTIWVEPVTDFVTRVRVRSASRMGKGDFGQNARNIRQFFRALDERLGAVKFDPERLESEASPQSDDSDAGDEEGDAGSP